MFIARMVFFRLHESPRYLVHAGRAQEALESLQMISRFNGSELSLDLEDVDDNRPPTSDTVPFLAESPVDECQNRSDEGNVLKPENEVNLDANKNPSIHPNESSFVTQSSADFLRTAPSGVIDYHSTSECPNSLDGQGHSLVSPVMEYLPASAHGLIVRPTLYTTSTPDVPEFKDVPPEVSPPSPYPPATIIRPPRPRPRSGSGHASVSSSRGSVYKVKRKMRMVLPRWVRKPLLGWLDRVAMVLSPEWMKTTLLMWMIWFAMSLGALGLSSDRPSITDSFSWMSQRLRCSTCSYPNCWSRVRKTMLEVRKHWRLVYGTSSYLLSEVVQAPSWVPWPLLALMGTYWVSLFCEIAWCILSRITDGPSGVTCVEHLRHCVFLLGVCYG